MCFRAWTMHGKHKFIVNVLDFAGNPGKIGGGDEEYYEVDVVAPIVNSLAFNTASYPVIMTFNIPNASPETSFTLVATKEEITKTWQGVITENGSFEKSSGVDTPVMPAASSFLP